MYSKFKKNTDDVVSVAVKHSLPIAESCYTQNAIFNFFAITML